MTSSGSTIWRARVEPDVGTAETTGEPVVRYPMPEGSVAGEDVPIDDVADTGGSISRAEEYVMDREPGDVSTATLQLLWTSTFEPDYVGERLSEPAWIVSPWKFVEDVVDLICGVVDKEGVERFDRSTVRRLRREYHEIERIQLEVAQPGRLEEVLREMERRGSIVAAGDDEWTLAGDR